MQSISKEDSEFQFPIEEKRPIKLSVPIRSLKTSQNTMATQTTQKKSSYDDEDTDNYFEDRQEIYDGSQEHPEFTKQHVLLKKKDRSLKGPLTDAGFPPEIVAKGDDICCKMESGLRRGAKIRQLTFYCALQAYKELNIPEDPNKIAQKCGVTPPEISKALSMCSPAKTKYKPVQVKRTPEEYIRVSLKKLEELGILNFSPETADKIEEICREAMEKDPELKEEKPQSVAAAAVVFYLGLNRISIDKNKYTEIFSRSDMTIGKIKKKINTAYNS